MNRWHPPPLMVYLALAVLSAGLYLAFSRQAGDVGFPLDDAWIHQTYARSLGERGEFAFLPGQPSAGSTAPLWTALLALGYALGWPPLLWAYGAGMLLLALTAWLVHRQVLLLKPSARLGAWVAGGLALTEWHLVWSAGSGMETLLLAVLALVVFSGSPRARWPGLGLAAGLAVWVRPDGLLLLPCLLARWFAPGERRGRRFWLNTLTAAAALAAYLGLNLALSGTLWPNTLYAKQAEYAALTEAPLPARLGQMAAQPFIGVVALLAPGLISLVVARWSPPEERAADKDGRAAKPRAPESQGPESRAARLWPVALPLLWAAAVIGAYALRLPATYQHGRYLMPVIPVLLALGVAGLAGWLRPNSRRPWRRVASRVWLTAGAAVAAGFWWLGAQAYARDVQIIQTEMVPAAKWVETNTAPDALIAAHDIGALGYYGERPVLDLAGLVSPEVIPFMRDEAQLALWLDAAGADYLLTFPAWYPALTAGPHVEAVYATGGAASPAAGGENMVVYRWRDR